MRWQDETVVDIDKLAHDSSQGNGNATDDGPKSSLPFEQMGMSFSHGAYGYRAEQHNEHARDEWHVPKSGSGRPQVTSWHWNCHSVQQPRTAQHVSTQLRRGFDCADTAKLAEACSHQ